MRELIYGHAVRNAAQHGKADAKAVLSKVLGERPELRSKAREVLKEVQEVVREVNSLSVEELLKEAEGFAVEKTAKVEKALEELPRAKKGEVRLRFAPNPSGPLHLGHARAAVLNDEYAKEYNGTLILRFEDTDPKRVDVEAYDLIREDLAWLGVKADTEILQSKRFELYQDHARALIEKGAAYVCTCSQEDFKKLREAGKACGCREERSSVEEFEKMFDEYGEGKAVLRLKTDLSHRNISMRDFPIMRIVDTPHPLAGDWRVYPLMNFSVAVDDHDLKLTHILRGKDHILNTHKQAFIFEYFSWKRPIYIHYGLLKIEGVMLSTSEIKEGIEEGKCTGWDDVRLGTLAALRRRGIRSDAARKAMLDVGIKATDITFSWKNLYAHNKELVDPAANRYSFVETPITLRVTSCPETVARNRLHPTFDRGFRTIELDAGTVDFLTSASDFSSLKTDEVIRLMGAYNVKITSKDEKAEATFHSLSLDDARKKKAKLINWVPEKENVEVVVISPEGKHIGAGEKALEDVKIGDIVQFERFGFVKIDEKNKKIVAIFAHK